MSQSKRADRRRAIAAMVQAGATRQETADFHGVTLATVGIACREAGMKSKRGGTFSSYVIIADLINTSATLGQLAEKYGKHLTDVHAVYQRCQEHGIPVRERKPGRPKATI